MSAFVRFGFVIRSSANHVQGYRALTCGVETTEFGFGQRHGGSAENAFGSHTTDKPLNFATPRAVVGPFPVEQHLIASHRKVQPKAATNVRLHVHRRPLACEMPFIGKPLRTVYGAS